MQEKELNVIQGGFVLMAEIIVLIVEPGKTPRLARMENTVEAFEKLVGTPLDFGCFMPEKVMLISNANGAGQGLPPNRANPRGKEYLFGTFLLCGVGEDFASIPATQAEYFKKYFEKPGKLKLIGTEQMFSAVMDIAVAAQKFLERFEAGEAALVDEDGGEIRASAGPDERSA